MYLLLERGHKGSSILSSLFCVLGWPGLPLWWPQDVALVSCCVFCFRFFFFLFVFYLTKVFLTLFLEVFLLLVFEISSLFIWGLCVNFVLLLKFFFFYVVASLCVVAAAISQRGLSDTTTTTTTCLSLSPHFSLDDATLRVFLTDLSLSRSATSRIKKEKKENDKKNWSLVKKFYLLWVSFF